MSETPATLPRHALALIHRLRWALGLLAIGLLIAWFKVWSPVHVKMTRVERGTVVVEAFGRGTVESQREAAVGFDLVGRVSEVLVDEGSRVTIGQELARLETSQSQAELRSAQTGVGAARAALQRLAADEERARALLATAEREARRTQALFDAGAVPGQQRDDMLDKLALAQAELARVLAQRAEATRGIDVAAGGAEQRRVAVVRATLLAPFEGVITRRLREPGDTVAIGSTVLRLVDTSRVFVNAAMDETVLSQLAVDQPATIVFPGTGQPIAGKVSKIAWEADRQTHELFVEVTPASLERRIAIGQRADVRIELARHDNALRIPIDLIHHDEAGAFVYASRGGKIARIRPTFGLTGSAHVEVLDGLAEGDELLAALGTATSLPLGLALGEPMNLALRDVRRQLARFVGTAAGLGLLLTVVIAMQGIYAGMVDDATILTRAMRADVWLVQKDTRGPFAEGSRLDPSVEARAAALPGVRSARPYTYQLIQREHRGAVMRIALVGLGWPDDPGRSLPLVRGRRLSQPHGEIIVDASLGLEIGAALELAGETYRVVGLTKNALTSGGDSVAFLTAADAQLVAYDQPPEAAVLERERVASRLRQTDLGRGQPSLEELATDPRWRPPALASPPVAAVLLEVDPHRLAEVRGIVRSWGDVSVYSQAEEEALLLGGVVQRARMQIGLFTVILTLTAAVIVMMVMYNLTLEKTHDLAVLKLMGAPGPRLLGLVLQQAWLLGAIGYAVAFALGALAYPMFPRRVLITEAINLAAPIATMILVTLASLLGLSHVMRIDPSRALEA